MVLIRKKLGKILKRKLILKTKKIFKQFLSSGHLVFSPFPWNEWLFSSFQSIFWKISNKTVFGTVNCQITQTSIQVAHFRYRVQSPISGYSDRGDVVLFVDISRQIDGGSPPDTVKWCVLYVQYIHCTNWNILRSTVCLLNKWHQFF